MAKDKSIEDHKKKIIIKRIIITIIIIKPGFSLVRNSAVLEAVNKKN